MSRSLGLAMALALLAGAAQANGGNHHHNHHHDGGYTYGHDDFFDGPDEVYVYQFGSGADGSLANGIAGDRKSSSGIDIPSGAAGICPVISGNGKCSGGAWGTN